MTTWTVPAVVLRFVDADTLFCRLDLGWRLYFETRCRLAKVDAPELTTEAGQAALAWVRDVACPPGTAVMFVSHRLDGYGRPLGDVLLPDGSDLGERLLEAGHAVVYREKLS